MHPRLVLSLLREAVSPRALPEAVRVGKDTAGPARSVRGAEREPLGLGSQGQTPLWALTSLFKDAEPKDDDPPYCGPGAGLNSRAGCGRDARLSP